MTQYNSPEDIPWFQKALKHSQETMNSTPEVSRPSSMQGRVFMAPIGNVPEFHIRPEDSEDWTEILSVRDIEFTFTPDEKVDEVLLHEGFTLEVEFNINTFPPRSWYLLTGRRMSLRHQIAYYARKATSWLKKISQKHTS